MDDTDLQGYGYWLLTVIEALMVFIAFWLGHLVNGLAIELFTMLSVMIGASQVLIFKLVKKYFKIPTEAK